MVKKRSLIVIIAITVVAIYALGNAVAIPPGASTSQVTVKVKPGNLTWTPSPDSNLNDVTLDGTDQSTTGTLGNLQVTEARGKKIGWYLTVVAGDFQDAVDPSLKILATGFEVVAPVAVNPITGNGGVTSAGGFLDSPVTMLDTGAATGNGLGINESNPNIRLQVPAETYVGTYASTVTETLISYP